MRLLRPIIIGGAILLSILGLYAAIDRTIWMVSRLVEGGSDHPYLQHPLLALSHVAFAIPFMGLGPFQFATKLRARYPRYHRWSGRIFISCGLLSVWTSMVLIFYLPRQVGEVVAVVFYGSLLTVALFLALWYARHHQFNLHREWMIRGFTIGLGVVMTRLFLLILGVKANQPDFWIWFDAMLWLGFTSTLLVGEVWINFTRKKTETRVPSLTDRKVAHQTDFHSKNRKSEVSSKTHPS